MFMETKQDACPGSDKHGCSDKSQNGKNPLMSTIFIVSSGLVFNMCTLNSIALIKFNTKYFHSVTVYGHGHGERHLLNVFAGTGAENY